jgi:hypothetical protein
VKADVHPKTAEDMTTVVPTIMMTPMTGEVAPSPRTSRRSQRMRAAWPGRV